MHEAALCQGLIELIDDQQRLLMHTSNLSYCKTKIDNTHLSVFTCITIIIIIIS